jgi:hypothetical protein
MNSDGDDSDSDSGSDSDNGSCASEGFEAAFEVATLGLQAPLPLSSPLYRDCIAPILVPTDFVTPNSLAALRKVVKCVLEGDSVEACLPRSLVSQVISSD